MICGFGSQVLNALSDGKHKTFNISFNLLKDIPGENHLIKNEVSNSQILS